jgi:hypothetical protein
MANSYYVKLKDASSNVYYPIVMKGSQDYYFITGSVTLYNNCSSSYRTIGNVYVAYATKFVSLTNGETPIAAFGGTNTDDLSTGYLLYLNCNGTDSSGNYTIQIAYYKIYTTSSSASSASLSTSITGHTSYIAVVY